MIPWLLQSFADCPPLAQGQAPPGLLSAGEQHQFATLNNARRRREWLLGRWCAKRLLQRVIQERTGTCPPLDELSIIGDAQGAPTLHLETELPHFHLSGLSLSHSGEYALCALSLDEGVRVGVDIERVEARPAHFVQSFVTEAEQAQLVGVADEIKTLLLAIMWGAKEAALKATTREGLSLEAARRICCTVPWPPRGMAAGWYPLMVQTQNGVLTHRGGWRLHKEYVLTVLLLRRAPTKAANLG